MFLPRSKPSSFDINSWSNSFVKWPAFLCVMMKCKGMFKGKTSWVAGMEGAELQPAPSRGEHRSVVSLGRSSHRGRARASPLISSSYLDLEEAVCFPWLCPLAWVCFKDQQSRWGWFTSHPEERWLSLGRIRLARGAPSLWSGLGSVASFADEPVACLVLSRQRLHVQPDQEAAERRHLRHGPVGGPHRHHALLPEGVALLPRLDVRPARQAEPHHQDLDGNAAPARSWWGGFCFFLPCLEACRTLVPNRGSNLNPWQWKTHVLTAGLPGSSLVDDSKTA